MKPETVHQRFETDLDDVYTRPPWHVVRRMAALIPLGDSLEHVDFLVTDDGAGTVSGQALVVTSSVFVQSKFEGSPKSPESESSATAHVVSWPRTKIARVAIHDAAGNSDYAWQEDWAGRWPPNSTVSLHFDGGIDEVTLPMGKEPGKKTRQLLFEFVPTLLKVG